MGESESAYKGESQPMRRPRAAQRHAMQLSRRDAPSAFTESTSVPTKPLPLVVCIRLYESRGVCQRAALQTRRKVNRALYGPARTPLRGRAGLPTRRSMSAAVACRGSRAR